MLPAAHRLRRTREFSGTVRAGRRAGRRHLVAYLCTLDEGGAREPSTSSDEPAKVGMIVSRAVGGAVQRNEVKRRLREVLAAQLDRLPKGSFLVIRALPSAAGAPSSVLRTDISGALDRLLGQRS